MNGVRSVLAGAEAERNESDICWFFPYMWSGLPRLCSELIYALLNLSNHGLLLSYYILLAPQALPTAYSETTSSEDQLVRMRGGQASFESIRLVFLDIYKQDIVV